MESDTWKGYFATVEGRKIKQELIADTCWRCGRGPNRCGKRCDLTAGEVAEIRSNPDSKRLIDRIEKERGWLTAERMLHFLVSKGYESPNLKAD
jgi:hypothetical protein